ncbi:MAG: M48 family metalloprotease [Deltaproteobacteria bacterium]|nr:M48 family metalloprotease [Deltaproteobacteria bacterium]
MKTGCRRFKYTIFLFTISLISFHTFTDQPSVFALSIEKETILGRQFLGNIRKHYDFLDDDFVDGYINDLGEYLVRPLKTKHFPFHFYIIKDNDLNAFAGPGGHIFMFAGLIEAMDKVDELAAVLCHEIGHVSARHLSHRIEQSKKMGLATMAGILAGTLLHGQLSEAIITGSMAAGIQKQLSYSRDDERQADQLGHKYMDQAGFDPYSMITALRKIQEGQWLNIDHIPPYLLTHPVGPERMSNIETMLSTYTVKQEREETARFKRLFPFFKTILQAKYLEPHDAERLFNRELEKNPDSTIAHFGLGMVWKERAEYPKAIDNFQKALKRLPESLPVLRHLGEAYQLKGEDREAIEVFERALKIDSRDKASLYLQAMSFQNIEKYSTAIRIYERLTSMEPVRHEVFYNLGLSYGREDRLGLAHYNSGIYFKRVKKREEARFHFQKANELSDNDPSLKRRIKKEMKDLR